MPHPTPNEPIYQVLSTIPPGRVVTYGQLAQLAGLGRGARQVARALSNLPPNTRLPWHRVINAQGRISLPPPAANKQRHRLEAEGVHVQNNRINLKRFQWHPE
ncbi:MAG: MGMT family protein [Cellvibrionales bacterium]|nr:MGMT family protein [Cellvibrionales bacterium]